ncbi:hypothetical protein LIER_38427 [Lithospermum erythrorhizon]|uniref:Uncharacterized protein n=1 Tax=Lithospermum erythrorhizon TaxID=34254 RepID=A0AAV3Q4A3_LITER
MVTIGRSGGVAAKGGDYGVTKFSWDCSYDDYGHNCDDDYDYDYDSATAAHPDVFVIFSCFACLFLAML